MKNFVAIYYAPAPAIEKMFAASPEEMQKVMAS